MNNTLTTPALPVWLFLSNVCAYYFWSEATSGSSDQIEGDTLCGQQVAAEENEHFRFKLLAGNKSEVKKGPNQEVLP